MVAVVALSLSIALAIPALAYHEPVEYFRLRDPEIGESSGVASSSERDGLYFTHNDSGDDARFFALDEVGCTLAVFDFEDTGIVAIDWEDMARGRGPKRTSTLWFGDIGDNGSNRPFISVYRTKEPTVAARANTPDTPCAGRRQRTIAATGFKLSYEDGPRDAEALLVHPRTGQVFIVTKVYEGEAGVYAAPRRLRAKGRNVLRRVASIPDEGDVTGGAIDPDGSRLVLRTYDRAYEWSIPSGDVAAMFAAEPLAIALPAMPQGEAITYTRDGDALVTTSETAGSVVYRLDDHP